MTDVTVKRIEDMDSLNNGALARARAELGVTAFGMQVVNLPAEADGYPEHAHSGGPIPIEDGQEEVYVPLSGSGILITGDERTTLEPGMMARVGPTQVRKVITESQPLQFLVIGGVPGAAYSAPPFTELGAPAPGA
jgi:mannose-6-phosphate isomerase-like protein (cupin superfamily)